MLRFVTLFAAQMFDFATFNAMVGSKGVAAEANPLVQGLFLNFGTPAVVIAKILLISLIMALGVAAAVRGGEGRWGAVGGMPLAIGIAAGLIGGITNAAVILP